jgi:hypothetical protein
LKLAFSFFEAPPALCLLWTARSPAPSFFHLSYLAWGCLSHLGEDSYRVNASFLISPRNFVVRRRHQHQHHGRPVTSEDV